MRARPCRPRKEDLAAMTLRRLRTLALGALVLPLTLVGTGAAHAFELQTLDAARTRIADHVGGGKWSLVQLWTTDCVPCEQQKPMLAAFDAAHASTDARVLGVALDGLGMIDEIRAIDARHGSPYPTLVAFDDVFAEQFEALAGRPFRATPTYLLYGPDGAFAGAHVGPIAPEALEAIVAP